MKLGVMQLSQPNIQLAQNVATNPAVNTSSSINGFGGKFGEVFNQVISQQSNESNKNLITNDLEQLTTLLDSDSLEEVLDLLGIGHSEGLLFIQFNGEMKEPGELMNLEDLLSMLNMDNEQLLSTLQQLLGSVQLLEETPLENLLNLLDEKKLLDTQLNDEKSIDVWQLLQLINEQGPNLLSQLTSAIKGEHSVITPKDAEKFVSLIKLAQLIGEHSDLTYNQPSQLANVKDLMQLLSEQVELQSQKNTQYTGIQTIINKSLREMEIVVKQTETENKSTNELTQTQMSTQQVSASKTFTITLPAEKSAQGETLVKEIQNLIGRSQLSNNNGTMKLLLKLYPENLGSIRIEIMQKDGVLTARLLATTSQTKELLESQLNQLKTAFAHANIQMERIDVAQSLQETDRNFRDQSLFSNLFNQQKEEKDKNNDSDEDEEEEMSFQDYLLNEEV